MKTIVNPRLRELFLIFNYYVTQFYVSITSAEKLFEIFVSIFKNSHLPLDLSGSATELIIIVIRTIIPKNFLIKN